MAWRDERTEFEKGIESMESGLPLTLFPRRFLANKKVSRDWSDVGRQVVSLGDGVTVFRGFVLTTRKSSGACRNFEHVWIATRFVKFVAERLILDLEPTGKVDAITVPVDDSYASLRKKSTWRRSSAASGLRVSIQEERNYTQ